MSPGNVLLPPCVEQKLGILHISQASKQKKKKKNSCSENKREEKASESYAWLCEYIYNIPKMDSEIEKEENAYFSFLICLHKHMEDVY